MFAMPVAQVTYMYRNGCRDVRIIDEAGQVNSTGFAVRHVTAHGLKSYRTLRIMSEAIVLTIFSGVRIPAVRLGIFSGSCALKKSGSGLSGRNAGPTVLTSRSCATNASASPWAIRRTY